MALAAGAMLAAEARGQDRRIELTPFVAGFIPTTALGSIRVPGFGTVLTVEGDVTASPAFGARLTVIGPGRLGVEAAGFYGTSDLRITGGPFTTTIDAEQVGGALKGVYRATSENTGTDLMLSAGVSGIHHGGEAFRFASNQFDIGGVLGAGLHITMSPQLTLRFDGEAYLYQWSFGPTFASRTQVDLLMTAGLGLRLRR
jgi:hypothetical protein